MNDPHMPVQTIDTPPLKDGWVRWIHITHGNVDAIKKTGLQYATHGMISSTALLCDKTSGEQHLISAHTGKGDPRFTLRDGSHAIIIDLPERLSRIHDWRGGDVIPTGTVPPEFIRAVVSGKDLSVSHVQDSPKSWSEEFALRPAALRGRSIGSGSDPLPIPKPTILNDDSVW